MLSIQESMHRTQNVRNISVIAHVDHGKSTLVDSLLAKGGLIKKSSAGTKVGMDTEEQEINRGITIKSCGVSLLFQRQRQRHRKTIDNNNNNTEPAFPYLINLIDSPGHVDFSSEVTAALRVTDGAIVVVDCIEGVMVQTETVLRQAVQERIKPVLFLNKLDRQFLELNAPLEEMYKTFRNTIESVNAVCDTYKDPVLGNIEISVETGKVGFGSGLHCWGFTLQDFASMYSNRFALSEKSLMRKFWGDHYFDAKAKQWTKKKTTTNDDNNNNVSGRGFCEFVLKPIKVLIDSIMREEKEIYEPIIRCLGLRFSKQELDECKRAKDYLKLVMRTWLPAADTLVEMICEHLPSPIEAQQYRIPLLYTGPLDTEEAQCMINCDPEGPLSMYISKMVPQKGNTGQFIAFGRVFSGSVKPGQEIRIMGANYEHGSNRSLEVRKVQGVLCMMANSTMSVSECTAGNICGLVGIDKYLVKSGTLSTSANVCPFKTMKFSVAAVVKVAVEPVKASDLQKLVQGLKRIVQYDPLLKVSHNKQGQHIIAGAGELHLECSLKTLCTDYLNGAEIRVSNPITSFCETITSHSGGGHPPNTNSNNNSTRNTKKNTKNNNSSSGAVTSNFPSVVVGKSRSGLNRLSMSAEPMTNTTLISDLDSGNFGLNSRCSRSKLFSKQFLAQYPSWSKEDANKIWTFGCPPDARANVLVDRTKGVSYLNEVRDSIISSFMHTSATGVLCGEPLKRCRFNLLDGKIHSDSSHRGPGELIPVARKCVYAAQIASQPKLLEPVYLVDISVPTAQANAVYKTLNVRRGEVDRFEECVGTPLCNIRAFIPVLETFGDKMKKRDGFTELLRKNTGGKGFAQMRFSHWKEISGDPMVDGSISYSILMEVRKRKGMKMEIPLFSDYHNRK